MGVQGAKKCSDSSGQVLMDVVTKTTIPQTFPSTDSHQGQVSPAFPASLPSCGASVLCRLLHSGPAMASLEYYKEADNLFP